nr:class I SAM-dependent methyltransferase [Cellulomonas denverensis]
MDTSVPNNSHTIIVGLVPEGATVLDVGCASGYLGRGLQQLRGCRVSGVEIDPEDAEKARADLDRVEVANLNDTLLDDLFDPGSFDVVVFGDVLEHVLDPARAVRSATRLLRPGGRIVISVPNVAHGSVRLALLQGRWDYRDTGLLDRTHVSFFTYESLIAMLHGAGLAITELRATVFDALSTEVEVDAQALPVPVVDWVRSQPYSEVYQFVLSASPAAEVDGPEVTEVVPAELLAPADDEHTARAQEQRIALEAVADPQSAAATILRMRHEALIARDHAKGQEAELGVLRAQVAQEKAIAGFLHVELRKSHEDSQHAHAELAKSIAHGQRLQHSLDGGIPSRVRAVAAPFARSARNVVRRARER